MDIQSLCTEDLIDEVIGLYSSMVYRIALSYVKSRHDADDIFQEVFLKYFSKNRIFESEEHRKAWFIRVTINSSKKFCTSSWMKKTLPLEEEISFMMPEENELYIALRRLPSKYRIVLHLFYFEDLSAEEIGRILKIKPAAVRMRLTRGRKLLKKNLKGEYFYE